MCSVYIVLLCVFFFFKQKTAYEMRISDWSSDVCSSDLVEAGIAAHLAVGGHVDHHHAQRPVAAGLQGEHAAVLDEAGEAAAERQQPGEQARHTRRIVVAASGVDRECVVEGKCVYVRVELGGRGSIIKNTSTHTTTED